MDTKVFQERRRRLREEVKDGAILIMGQKEAVRNYTANVYPFRQDSHFLYYTGVNLPDLSLLILPDGKEWMFGPTEDPGDLIWHGPHPVLRDHADNAGVESCGYFDVLETKIRELLEQNVLIHYLPIYRSERVIEFSQLFKRSLEEVSTGASPALAHVVTQQRSIKSDDEVKEIEKALEVSAKMYGAALQAIAPGKKEAEIAGLMQGIALSHDYPQSFLPIVSVRGEVLHNNSYGNTMKEGELLLVDSGVESSTFYCSDITRTFPVSGKYEARQKDVYNVVLNSQLKAIEKASPKLTNKELHLVAAEEIARGLIDIGLMKGDAKAAVEAGAHALFFPHGLGHMMGLDVHDMEDLGDSVGYQNGDQRSEQFGLSFLRLARPLQPGYVITVEPGVYFIPALIDMWANEKKHEQFISYQEVEKYRGFGGVRIEDDILITESGCKVLGTPIPKAVDEVEAAMAK